MPKVEPEVEVFARIKVVGVGGSGKNAVNHMINSKIKGIEFIVMNTDAQDLHHSLAPKKIHIGKNLTHGRGAGGDPEVGRKAAEETKEEIQGAIQGADMVFIACGLGGGTGSFGSSVVASVAKEQGALTIGVVTKPFSFEGNYRARVATQGLNELSRQVDALIIIPNDRVMNMSEKEMTFKSAFTMCDEVLRQAVQGISDLITTPGIINVDFADVRSILANSGSALLGIGSASGENRAKEAALMAINSPLLETSMAGAKGVLFTIAGNDDLLMHEINEIAKVITDSIDPEAKVIFGAIRDEKLKKNEIKVTVIASGFSEVPPEKKSLFSGDTKEKVLPREEKREIHNGFLERETKESKEPKKVDISTWTPDVPPVSKATNGEKEPVTIIDLDNEIDEDWSVVPAFLRRKK